MVFYFVQRGETLYAIARRYHTTVHAIVVANRLEDPNAISPGQALIIPRPGEVPSPPPGGIVHLVRSGENVFQLAARFGSSVSGILRANQIAHPEFILPGQQLVIPERSDPGDDWPMFGRTPGRTGAGPVILPGVPVEGWSFVPRRPLAVRPSAPVMRYDRVFAGLGDGQFYSLDRKTGRAKWRIGAADSAALEHFGDHALATPAIYDGLAYLCGPDGSIQAVDAHSGQPVWKVSASGPISSSPAVIDGLVCLGCWDEHVYAIEAKTGAIAWKRPVGAPLTLPVAAGDPQLFAVDDNGMLWALDSHTGEVLWQAELPEPRSPVFAEVVVLAGDRALDPKNGQILWQVKAGDAIPVARVDQVVYPGGAVDLFTGLPRGPQTSVVPTAAEVTIPPPAIPLGAHVVSGALLIGVGEDQQLHARDLDMGHAVWSIPLPADSHQPPAVAARQIAVSLADGSLRTFQFAEA